MKTFQERINELRFDLIREIVKILRENGLTSLELSEDLTNPTFVIWHNSQEEIFYNTPVLSVSIAGEHDINAEVKDFDSGCSDTISSVDGSLSNLEWLIGLQNDILETLKLQCNGD